MVTYDTTEILKEHIQFSHLGTRYWNTFRFLKTESPLRNYSIQEITKRLEKRPMRPHYIERNKAVVEYVKANYKTKSITQLAIDTGVTKTSILRRLKEAGINKKPGVYSLYKNYTQETKIILNTETGVYYPNLSEAARAANINIRTFQMYIQKFGEFKNLKEV